MRHDPEKHGLTGPVLGPILEDILCFCRLSKLPLLTSIVVEQTAGLPAGGSPLGPHEVPAEQAAVFNYGWADVAVPTETEFENARAAASHAA